MENVSFVIDEQTKNKIIDFYKDYKVDNTNPYIIFFAKYENMTISIFQSKKGFKAFFSGINALYEARIFNKDATINESKKVEKLEFITFDDQIGSDEVGFGDFFGPIIVVAAYFDKSLSSYISQIKDSKKLTDEFILKFVPTILDKVIFSKLTVHNDKFNELIDKGYSMNKIKAIMHNTALLNVKKKVNKDVPLYIDQFAEEDLYYSYLSHEKNIANNIVFKTKGESLFPSVALASMIARYSFLKEMDLLSEKYHLAFVKGASINTDNFAKLFVQKYGLEELSHVCKRNFSNYSKLLTELNF